MSDHIKHPSASTAAASATALKRGIQSLPLVFLHVSGSEQKEEEHTSSTLAFKALKGTKHRTSVLALTASTAYRRSISLRREFLEEKSDDRFEFVRMRLKWRTCRLGGLVGQLFQPSKITGQLKEMLCQLSRRVLNWILREMPALERLDAKCKLPTSGLILVNREVRGFQLHVVSQFSGNIAKP